jgi:hypothetical protein
VTVEKGGWSESLQGKFRLVREPIPNNIIAPIFHPQNKCNQVTSVAGAQENRKPLKVLDNQGL